MKKVLTILLILSSLFTFSDDIGEIIDTVQAIYDNNTNTIVVTGDGVIDREKWFSFRKYVQNIDDNYSVSIRENVKLPSDSSNLFSSETTKNINFIKGQIDIYTTIDTSNVTNMSGMFNGTTNANPDISLWDVSNVNNMSYMFYFSESMNSDLSSWNVSSVKDMSYMFSQTTLFNSDISNWNVSNVKNMSNMFSEAKNFNFDISSWDITNVNNMSKMFYNAKYMNIDVTKWKHLPVSLNVFDSAFNGANISNYDFSSLNLSQLQSKILNLFTINKKEDIILPAIKINNAMFFLMIEEVFNGKFEGTTITMPGITAKLTSEGYVFPLFNGLYEVFNLDSNKVKEIFIVNSDKLENSVTQSLDDNTKYIFRPYTIDKIEMLFDDVNKRDLLTQLKMKSDKLFKLSLNGDLKIQGNPTLNEGENSITLLFTQDDKTINIPVIVKINKYNSQYKAIGKDITVSVNTTLTDEDAKNAIVNNKDLNATYKWKNTINTSFVGEKTGIVVVTYKDNSVQEVKVKVLVEKARLDVNKYMSLINRLDDIDTSIINYANSNRSFYFEGNLAHSFANKIKSILKDDKLDQYEIIGGLKVGINFKFKLRRLQHFKVGLFTEYDFNGLHNIGFGLLHRYDISDNFNMDAFARYRIAFLDYLSSNNIDFYIKLRYKYIDRFFAYVDGSALLSYSINTNLDNSRAFFSNIYLSPRFIFRFDLSSTLGYQFDDINSIYTKPEIQLQYTSKYYIIDNANNLTEYIDTKNNIFNFRFELGAKQTLDQLNLTESVIVDTKGNFKANFGLIYNF